MNFAMRSEPQKFFLMPIPPTPNGRLHLGHIAGPYLRMDMLARHLRSQDHHVDVVSAVDGFDSYVLWKALQEARSPQEVCRDYHGRIAHDLAALDIVVDEFLDVVQGPHAERHAENAQRAVSRLVEQGLTETITEKVLYSPATGRFLAGAWLVGRCPQCDVPSAGYFCEACGAHFRPEAMRAPEPRVGDTQLEWREVDSLFLRIVDEPALIDRVSASGAPLRFINVIRRFLAQENGLVRLTAPGDWGVAWPPDRYGNPRVLFEAGWEYALTCGDRCADGKPDAHPMSSNGNVTTLVSFGIDNAVLLLAGSAAVLGALPDCKPFDHVLTNYFYNLQGSKFSTSRLHVVWAADIVEATPASSDAVRYFLARESPEHNAANFDVDIFIHFVNDDLATRLQGRLDVAGAALESMVGTSVGIATPMLDKLIASFHLLDESFRLDAVSVRSACAVVRSWIELPQIDLTDAKQAYGWLKGLACIAASIMPSLAGALWFALGHDGMPRRAELLAMSSPRGGLCGRQWFTPLSRESLDPCLPSALVRERGTAHA
ncbi:methionine--tRNA ligase [Paraburkholderia hospita]|uniref:methionine--tRNA ligase n=1 Tax=Paraburkholderia hospita TaxID=169430 RepID=UPI001F6178AE|nr:methionine--tRNA ligase [Paraburkholderia hospita]